MSSFGKTIGVLALAVTVVVHLLLHWQWIVAVIRRFFSRLPGDSRVNFVLNVAQRWL